MKKTFCDIDGCGEEAYVEDVDVCIGWIDWSKDASKKRTTFKPFDKPAKRKKDLCEKHYKIWCRATYEAFHGKVE